MNVDGNELSWADISDYLSKVGDKLIPTKSTTGYEVDYSRIYNDIECVSYSDLLDSSKLKLLIS